jgi:hypothetical protein
LNMALGNVSSTVAITSIASSFDNRYPVLPDCLSPAVAPSLYPAKNQINYQPPAPSSTQSLVAPSLQHEKAKS